MTTAFLTDASKRALTGAVKSVEARSCAEVVIAVRAMSGTYLHADIAAGALAGIATLAFLLFSPWGFALHFFLIDPVIVGVLVGWFSSRTSFLRRTLSSVAMRVQAVETGARATFCDKGIRHTSDKIGILVYISLLERRAEVVVDRGVAEAAPVSEWAAAVDAIAGSVASGADGAAVAKQIEALGDVLEPCLPREEDDVNELPDEVT